MRQTSLQQYASVFSGYTFRKSLTSNSDTIGVIQSRDTNVPAQEINYSGWASSPDFSGSDKYLLQDRDILLLSKGGNNSAFLFEKNKCTFPDAVAAGAFIVIRVMPAHLDAAYLAYFLNLPKTQAIFKSLQVGTTVQNLSIKHVQEVGIKMPPLPKQKTLGEVYIPTEYLNLIIPYAGLYYEHDDDYNMLSQHIKLGPFSLWVHDVFARKDIVLRPYAPFHLWALHFMYEDTLRAETFKTSKFTLEERQCNLFNLYSHMHRVPMAGGKKVLSFHINILPSDLMLLVQQHPGLYYLANKRVQRTSSLINEKPYRINAVCNMLIQNILQCRYIEAQAVHFLERCCLDLFINFAQQDAIADEIRPPSEAQTALFSQIFSYLTEHPHIVHTEKEIAKMFDLPGVKLAQGFRAQFSIGITPFLHMMKMMMIYNTLMQKACTLRELALIAGYRHIEEMISDLEKYYSCSLSALRRSM